MDSARPKRKRIRLEAEAYRTPGTLWFCTFDTERSAPLLAHRDVARLVCDTLEQRAPISGINLLLYVVMPTHVHVLVSVGKGDVVAYLGAVKSIVAVSRIRAGDRRRLWQRSFHDNGVRKPEEIDDLIGYMVNNPIKAGFVSQWEDYPWMGGTLVADG